MLATVHGQAALLPRYDVPTYYVSRELLAAVLRTELFDDMIFEAVRFHDALVFMLLVANRHGRAGSASRRVAVESSSNCKLNHATSRLGWLRHLRTGWWSESKH